MVVRRECPETVCCLCKTCGKTFPQRWVQTYLELEDPSCLKKSHFMTDKTNHLYPLNKSPWEKGGAWPGSCLNIFECLSGSRQCQQETYRATRFLTPTLSLSEFTLLSCHTPRHRPILVKHVCIDRRKSTWPWNGALSTWQRCTGKWVEQMVWHWKSPNTQ